MYSRDERERGDENLTAACGFGRAPVREDLQRQFEPEGRVRDGDDVARAGDRRRGVLQHRTKGPSLVYQAESRMRATRSMNRSRLRRFGRPT